MDSLRQVSALAGPGSSERTSGGIAETGSADKRGIFAPPIGRTRPVRYGDTELDPVIFIGRTPTIRAAPRRPAADSSAIAAYDLDSGVN